MGCERRGGKTPFRLVIIIGLFTGCGIEGILSLRVPDVSAPSSPRVFLHLLTGAAAWLMGCERTGLQIPVHIVPFRFRIFLHLLSGATAWSMVYERRGAQIIIS